MSGTHPLGVYEGRVSKGGSGGYSLDMRPGGGEYPPPWKWDLEHPFPVLIPSGGHQNTYGWQAGGAHPPGMLSCHNYLHSCGFGNDPLNTFWIIYILQKTNGGTRVALRELFSCITFMFFCIQCTILSETVNLPFFYPRVYLDSLSQLTCKLCDPVVSNQVKHCQFYQNSSQKEKFKIL